MTPLRDPYLKVEVDRGGEAILRFFGCCFSSFSDLIHY